MESDKNNLGEHHRIVETVLWCNLCKASNRVVFTEFIPGDDPVDESRVIECGSCYRWHQIVTENGGMDAWRKHWTEGLDRRPPRKGTSQSRPISSAFETNRRRH